MILMRGIFLAAANCSAESGRLSGSASALASAYSSVMA
jgi:hypothetical protein